MFRLTITASFEVQNANAFYPGNTETRTKGGSGINCLDGGIKQGLVGIALFPELVHVVTLSVLCLVVPVCVDKLAIKPKLFALFYQRSCFAQIRSADRVCFQQKLPQSARTHLAKSAAGTPLGAGQ